VLNLRGNLLTIDCFNQFKGRIWGKSSRVSWQSIAEQGSQKVKGITSGAVVGPFLFCSYPLSLNASKKALLVF
jgi:hypothetical protein